MRTKAEKLAVLAPVRAERNKAVVDQPFYELVFTLQASLDSEHLFEAFANHLASVVPHDGWAYSHPAQGLEMSQGVSAPHVCSYQLRLDDAPLGEWRASRSHPFSDHELAMIEAYLCRLIYPLRNALLYRQALQSAYLDPLTGTRNRGALFGSLQREWDMARRHGHPLSVIMLDVDHFKAVNDTYGHAAGDTVLQQVADCISHSVRGSDIVFRYGGEEFLILLANTGEEGAMQLAERVRSELERCICFSADGSPLRVTASFGVATLGPSDSKEGLVAQADEALYQAKRAGRNRVVAARD